jgi:polyisoprenoid-binding protein YceI
MSSAEIRRGLVVGSVLVVGVWISSSAAFTPKQSDEEVKEIKLHVDPAQSKVRWTLDSTLHTVHGTFAVKSGAMRIDPAKGKVEGEIVIDAASGDSGNDGRDKKMHREIIESAKYKEIVFRPERVEGKVVAEGSFSAQVHGIFLLHGAEHEITVPVKAELTPGHWNGTARFSVPYIAWNLKSPNNFFLKADKVVEVELELAGGEEVTVEKQSRSAGY